MIKIPGILYKYRSVRNPHTKTMLCNRELYFPTPSEINDPFDCRIVLNREAPAEELGRKLMTHYSQEYGVTDESEIVRRMLSEIGAPGTERTRARAAEIIEKQEWKVLPAFIEAGNERMLRGRLGKVRLCCFSELCRRRPTIARIRSPLPWSRRSDRGGLGWPCSTW